MRKIVLFFCTVCALLQGETSRSIIEILEKYNEGVYKHIEITYHITNE